MATYIGRFAPSPTGELHLGSLVCAIASYLDAKAHNGSWLVRIEDLDPPREPAWAAPKILETLRVLGLSSDEPIVYQSDRHHLYKEALDYLITNKFVYGCSCSRKQIAEYQNAREKPANIYPGICRDKHLTEGIRAWRFKVPSENRFFRDRHFGEYRQNIEQEVGDFVLKRADGFWAYQLAVVVDDHHQGITHIVRGADLLDNTPRQIELQKALRYRTPSYMHIPLVLGENGQKLSKQNGATGLDLENIDVEIDKAWTHLGFERFSFDSCEGFFSKAVDLWRKSPYFAK